MTVVAAVAAGVTVAVSHDRRIAVAVVPVVVVATVVVGSPPCGGGRHRDGATVMVTVVG